MPKLKIGDEWWTAPAEGDNGALVIVTGRKGVEPAIASGKYNERVEVTWKYEGNGLPDKETSRLMSQVDEALKEAFGKEGTAIMTGIYTGCGERNWIFYTLNVKTFERMFNRALEQFELLPISLYVEHDPQWNEYQEMKASTEIMDGE